MFVIRVQMDNPDCAILLAILKPGTFISELYGMSKTFLVLYHVPTARVWDFNIFKPASVAFS
jgi:hypothetical protein